MQSVNSKKAAMRAETQALLEAQGISTAYVAGVNEAVMPKGSMGHDSRGMAQCRLARKGK